MEQTIREMKFCNSCNSIVETEIIYSYHTQEFFIDELNCKGTVINLSKCLRCNEPILSEIDYHAIEEHYYENSNIQLYPTLENEAIKNCPKIVIAPYKEALKCYRAQAYEACVIMCRKGIEAICHEKGEDKGTLVTKLKKLKDRGILEITLYKWAEELRSIGNDGAHSHDLVVSQQDAKDAIDFFDALITYLYHLVSQYEELVERRKK